MVSIFLNKFRVIGNSVLEHIFDNTNTANFSKARHMRKHYCVCVKRITLCNCLCSSSSCFYASLIRTIQEFGAKNYFTDHETANTMHGFIDLFMVLKIHDCYQDLQKFEQLSIQASDTRRLGDLAAAVQCVHRNNPLQTVSKRVYAVYTYSNCVINQLLYC